MKSTLRYGLACLTFGIGLFNAGAQAQEGAFINVIDTSVGTPISSTDPSGLTVFPDTGTLGLVDSEIEETDFWATLDPKRNVSEFSGTGAIVDTLNIFRIAIDEPTGIAFNPVDGLLYITEDEVDRVYVIDQANPPSTAEERVFFQVPPATETGSNDPEGITVDPQTGNLFIASGREEVPTRGDVIEVTRTGQLVSSFQVPDGVLDPEGIYFDPRSGNLYLSSGSGGEADPEDDAIWVVSTDGELIREISLAALNASFGNPANDRDAGGRVRPKGITMAPSSDPNDDPSIVSLYITDWGVDAGDYEGVPPTDGNDGRIFELRANQSPTVSAGDSQTVEATASLNGTANDDGLPGNGLFVQWSKLSGPGDVAFDNGTALNTTARFSAPGEYALRLSATDGDITTSSDVLITARDGDGGGGNFGVAVSNTSNRSNPRNLQGETLAGDTFIFLTPVFPQQSINRVEFFVDGRFIRTERFAPYDLGSTSGNNGLPFDTRTLNDGAHAVDARVVLNNGSVENVRATFNVNNAPPPAEFSLRVSERADRARSRALAGTTVEDNVYVFVSPLFPERGISGVDFFIDGRFQKTEGFAPYDLAGTQGSGNAAPFNMNSLREGTHTITIRVRFSQGGSTNVSASFRVDD